MDEPYSIEIAHHGQVFAFSLSGEVVLGRQLTPRRANGAALSPRGERRAANRGRALFRMCGSRGGSSCYGQWKGPCWSSTLPRIRSLSTAAPICPRAPSGSVRPSGKLAFGPARNYAVSIWRDAAHATDMQTLGHEPPIPGREDRDDTREAPPGTQVGARRGPADSSLAAVDHRGIAKRRSVGRFFAASGP